MVAFLTKYQAVIAVLLVVALAVDLSPGIDYPRWLVDVLIGAAMACGVARPSEVAANLAASYSKRGIAVVASVVAYLVAAFTGPEAPPPADVIDVSDADVIDVEAADTSGGTST